MKTPAILLAALCLAGCAKETTITAVPTNVPWPSDDMLKAEPEPNCVTDAQPTVSVRALADELDCYTTYGAELAERHRALQDSVKRGKAAYEKLQAEQRAKASGAASIW